MKTNLNLNEISSPIRELRNKGNLVEASKALSKQAQPAPEEKPTKKEKKAKPAKPEKAPPVEKEQKLTAVIAEKDRTKYQNRAYLSPSYNAPELAEKFKDVIALRTLFIDAKGGFQVWNRKTAVSKIESEFLNQKDLKQFDSGDIAKWFKLFGGGYGDISRNSLEQLVKQGKLSKSKSDGKKAHFIYSKKVA